MSLLPAPPQSWTDRAACRFADPEAFFPAQESQIAAHPAKRICGQCRVRVQCLSEALRREDFHGIWGGLTGDERRDIIREQRKEAASA